MQTKYTAPRVAVAARRWFVRLAAAFSLTVALGLSSAQAALITAFSDFGPGNTYGTFGQSIGGQFVNGYKFTSAAAGPLAEVDVGIGGTGTFNLNLYTDNAGVLGSSIWSVTGIPVSGGSPNPAVINIASGPALSLSQDYWLVASGPSNSAFWSPNTTSTNGRHYHHDSGSDFYENAVLGAFAVKLTPEPATWSMLVFGVTGLGCSAHARRRKGRVTNSRQP